MVNNWLKQLLLLQYLARFDKTWQGCSGHEALFRELSLYINCLNYLPGAKRTYLILTCCICAILSKFPQNCSCYIIIILPNNFRSPNYATGERLTTLIFKGNMYETLPVCGFPFFSRPFLFEEKKNINICVLLSEFGLCYSSRSFLVCGFNNS